MLYANIKNIILFAQLQMKSYWAVSIPGTLQGNNYKAYCIISQGFINDDVDFRPINMRSTEAKIWEV